MTLREKVVCEVCGSDGEGGMIEYADRSLWHIRKIPKDGKVYPLMCDGKFVPVKEETPCPR